MAATCRAGVGVGVVLVLDVDVIVDVGVGVGGGTVAPPERTIPGRDAVRAGLVHP